MREDRRLLNTMNTCLHFRGIQHDTCEAGVALKDVKDVAGPGMARYPCLTLEQGKEARTVCPKRRLPTREEAEAIEAERDRRIRAFVQKTALGICGTCDVESTDWTQDGPCIYSQPCGHRVGQGNAKQYKAGVLEARAKRTNDGR